MIQLIITIVAIALTAVVLAASVSYIPWWYKTASDTQEVVHRSLLTMEQAYNVAARANNGTPPPVLPTQADGGFVTQFQPVIQLLPPTPPNFRWRYGLNSALNLNWFCLENLEPGGANEGAWRGVNRARSIFSPQQFVVSGSCGSSVSDPAPSSYPAPLTITYYVAYVPGISR